MKDLDFTVIAEENLPIRLKELIDEKKEQGFKITYQDNGFMYIGVGYGKQVTGGYSITVNSLFLSSNAVYIDTTLLAPKPGSLDEKKNSPSYPFIVLKTEDVKQPVVFE